MKGKVSMKFYVVTWMENDDCKTKIFKYRKAAEKFGCKMMCEHNTAVDISTFIDTTEIETSHYN